jgi:hypothetical protein
MKKEYKAPMLTVHGNVEEITQYIGSNPADDSFSLGGVQVNSDGSQGPLNTP